MRQRIREIRKNDKGFTLIELLIVIVILGVLAGIVVFAVQAFNNDGVATACRTDMKNVEIADEAYFAKTGAHATAVAPLTPIDTLVTAGYLKAKPNSAKYTVTLAGGAVTGTLAASAGGGPC